MQNGSTRESSKAIGSIVFWDLSNNSLWLKYSIGGGGDWGAEVNIGVNMGVKGKKLGR